MWALFPSTAPAVLSQHWWCLRIMLKWRGQAHTSGSVWPVHTLIFIFISSGLTFHEGLHRVLNELHFFPSHFLTVCLIKPHLIPNHVIYLSFVLKWYSLKVQFEFFSQMSFPSSAPSRLCFCGSALDFKICNVSFVKWLKHYYCLVVGKLQCVMQSVTEIWLGCDALPEELYNI